MAAARKPLHNINMIMMQIQLLLGRKKYEVGLDGFGIVGRWNRRRNGEGIVGTQARAMLAALATSG